MATDKVIDTVSIKFREGNPQEVRLMSWLRSQKELGKEFKSELMKAIIAFYDVYAIGENPDCTDADFEDAMTNCFIELSSHMSRVAAYGKTRKGINSPPDSWKQFGLLLVDSIAPSYPPTVRAWSDSDRHQSVASNLPTPEVPQRETTGERLSRENQERSDEIDRETPLDDVGFAPIPCPLIVISDVEDEDEDEETDEEYLARTASLIKVTSSKVVE